VDVLSAPDSSSGICIRLIDLFELFYEQNLEHRESLISHLFLECFQITGLHCTPELKLDDIVDRRHSSRASGVERRGRKRSADDLLEPIGSSFRKAAESPLITSTKSGLEMGYFEARMDLVLRIMERLLKNRFSANNLYINFLLDKVKPGVNVTSLGQRLRLPPPSIFFRYILLFQPAVLHTSLNFKRYSEY
jgi:hypothetical protein